MRLRSYAAREWILPEAARPEHRLKREGARPGDTISHVIHRCSTEATRAAVSTYQRSHELKSGAKREPPNEFAFKLNDF